jgi:hypothetical protein
MVPGLEPYFVSSFHDDARGVLATYGDVTASSSIVRNALHGLTTTIGMVATIDVMIFGALWALVLVGMGATLEVAVLVGIVGFVIGFFIFASVGMRTAIGQEARAESRFPTADDHPARPQP